MRRLFLEWCLIAIAAIGAITGLLAGHVTDRIDNVVYDVLVSSRPPAPSNRIVLVEIDDQSLATVGRWPWPRSVHARFLEQLAAARPAAVAYDALFIEPGPSNDDNRLGRAIRALGNVAVPALFVAPGHDGRPIDAALPVEPVAAAAGAIGHVALLPDVDGVARSVPLSLHASNRNWPHLMEATYRLANNHSSPATSRLAGQGDSRIYIHFQPGSGGFRSLSFASILADEVPHQFLQGRIILVGATAPGLGDRFRVPTHTGGLVSGIELQANLLNALLADRTITRPGIAIALIVSLIPTLILLIVFWRLQPRHALAAAIMLMSLALAVPALLLLFADIWLAPTPSLAGLLIVYPLWGWRRLQAVDSAISQELIAFAAETTPLQAAEPAAYLQDPIGGQTARLRSAIADMRDMRQLVTDTINGVNDPLLVTDLDDQIILTSQSALSLFDAEVHGVKATPLLAMHAGLEITRTALPSELQVKGRIFALHRFPLREHVGTHRGWILHLSDISEIRQAEQEREEMLTFLSHDMRSPQSSIISLLEQNRRWGADGHVAERIENLARRTLSLSDNFVELTRFRVASFEPEEINLTEILIEAADELWPIASRRNVQITIAGKDIACHLLGDREALGRALINLLDNAVKFSPENSAVRCYVRMVKRRIIECVIDDDGPGIPRDRQRALFARFGARQRGAGTRLSAGLGLAFVGAAVERHNGTIICQSRSPHGTRFILKFPAVDQTLHDPVECSSCKNG